MLAKAGPRRPLRQRPSRRRPQAAQGRDHREPAARRDQTPQLRRPDAHRSPRAYSPGDRGRAPDHPHHGHAHPDRPGPARPDRRAPHRQDRALAAPRPGHRAEPSRDAPGAAARRRAARGR